MLITNGIACDSLFAQYHNQLGACDKLLTLVAEPIIIPCLALVVIFLHNVPMVANAIHTG